MGKNEEKEMCEKCGQNEADLTLSVSINGAKEISLCVACAERIILTLLHDDDEESE